MREYRARKKALRNSLLMPGLRDGSAVETLLMTAHINTDFMNHPVSSTTEPSTSLMRVETDAYESTINSILRYKDYDSHKNAHEDFQERFVDNPLEEAKSLVEFLKRILNFIIHTDARQGTTRHGTTIDAVFSRFLDRRQSRIFISYFSYHKFIVSFLENDDVEN
ncbi:uncharacterized protein TNCV_4396821 [Trichonephila clavipes]|uniref:Uncharacterized protein n=1 Tax=Trichonephila clavipes TaxID=2585209 RepID=A0A8X7BE91_TRICX|nr:uncharacterized protein TNCV_4396821 [Trichonephila clavipes]